MNIKRANLGRKLVTEIEIDVSVFVLVNIYNVNIELEKLHTLNNILNTPEIFEDIENKNIILDGDFVILNCCFDVEDGKLVIKKQAIAKSIQSSYSKTFRLFLYV